MGMVVVGIDPGLTGALAFIGGPSGVVIEDIPTLALPGDGLVRRRVDGRALAEIVRHHCPPGEAVAVFCEAVGTMGGQNNAVQTQGSLLRSLGAIEAVFDMLRWPCVMVPPKTWQGFYALKGKKAENRAKGELPLAIVKARALYPQALPRLQRIKDHNRSEALLIAHWALRNKT
jgi:crossover junction endodeoxyribonuclease RuvC